MLQLFATGTVLNRFDYLDCRLEQASSEVFTRCAVLRELLAKVV
jgi:hypothetical protein